MSLEVYTAKIHIHFKTRVITPTFYFSVDNSTSTNPHREASALIHSLSVATDWLFFFASMITEKSRIRLFTCRRLRPEGATTAYNSYSFNEFPGRWLGDMTDDLNAAKIAWHFNGDQTGKHQVRIGPVGEGATQSDGWHPLMILSAEAFISSHATPRILETGDVALGCINHQMSGGTPIEQGQLIWPPSRQKNRRWQP